MNGNKRVSDAILARYRAEERPPSIVDEVVLGRLLVARHSLRLRRKIAAGAAAALSIAAVFGLLVWRGSLALMGGAVQVQSSYVHSAGDGLAADSHVDRRMPSTPDRSDSPPEPSFDDGTRVIQRAQHLIERRRYREAVHLLGSCVSLAGADDLAEDCEALLVEALCGVGDPSAEAKMRAFERERPDSYHWPALRDRCDAARARTNF